MVFLDKVHLHLRLLENSLEIINEMIQESCDHQIVSDKFIAEKSIKNTCRVILC